MSNKYAYVKVLSQRMQLKTVAHDSSGPQRNII